MKKGSGAKMRGVQNPGSRGGKVVGVRPNGDPIYASSGRRIGIAPGRKRGMGTPSAMEHAVLAGERKLASRSGVKRSMGEPSAMERAAMAGGSAPGADRQKWVGGVGKAPHLTREEQALQKQGRLGNAHLFRAGVFGKKRHK